MTAIETAREIVQAAVAERVFPAAVVEVGRSDGVNWTDALGTLTFDAGSPPARLDTPFDLASLAKPIATTSVVMDLVDRQRVALDEPIGRSFAEWLGSDRERATVRDLLEHASGLAARLVDAPPRGRREFEHEICAMKLEYAPRTQSVYSDLGFILLGFLAADRAGRSLGAAFKRLLERFADVEPALGREPLAFELPRDVARRAAPTEPMADDRRRGRRLVGEVHDNYAAALGGAAGHAGLFGTAAAVGAFGRVVLRAARGDRTIPSPLFPALVALATTKSTVPGSSRALGWDTMLPTSSCGTRMSASAFGHVGFTGTSLWIDPARDRYLVLLTNRACGGGTLDQMREVRRAFHDALGEI